MSDLRRSSAELIVSEEAGVRFVEGPAGGPFMRSIEDASLVVEACFNGRTRSALLYAPNLTDGFFDLSSGEAGAILQKLRNYKIRIAIVYEPDQVQFSSRFPEMVAEESRSDQVGIFDSARAARRWLCGTGGLTNV